MTAPKAIHDLVERFHRNIDTYQSSSYNETQVRLEFINPMFKKLGWDVDNEQGYAEAYKDVVHEDAIKVGGVTKAPDYCFRIGGVRKFFLEAKKPFVDLKQGIAPAYQLRRYAWSAKLPLSILTDFEEFAVYDCRIRPAPADKSSKARTFYIKYTDYPDRWREIAAIFHREEILKGSFDKYVESTSRKRGTAEVDTSFLAEIEAWRDTLARNIALRNADLTQRELNFAVQRTIDRIIFLRICEDRGIEDYGRLMALRSGADVYSRLRHLYDLADQRYNSGLFHFRKETNRPGERDTLTPRIKIDDKPLKEIIKHLYYPESPYEFSVLGADILGQVYEQFLGKVIRLTKGHQARVEEKPEVRKAGGVYYTPTYIVDYIVKNTVGKLLGEGEAPAEPKRDSHKTKAGSVKASPSRTTMSPRKAAKLRILDPACGSGSFLLGAYQYLLDWHLQYYITHDPEKWARSKNPPIFQTTSASVQSRRGEGETPVEPKLRKQTGSTGVSPSLCAYSLTTAERKRILLANIYGVDIDPQAVEVTKLSLLLKVLENENADTLEKQLALFHERALPDLANNIKCGNSLIGPDFYQNQQLDLLDEDEIYRINAFDWRTEFPQIMKNGGFDAVIGNPPYVRIQTMKEWAPAEVEYYKERYTAAKKGNYDIYVVFVEEGLRLLNDSGKLGFICPSKFLSTDYGGALRDILSRSGTVEKLVDFGHEQVFANATTYTCLLFLSHTNTRQITYIQASPKRLEEKQLSPVIIDSSRLSDAPWILGASDVVLLFDKVNRAGVQFRTLWHNMSRGVSTGNDAVFSFGVRDGVVVTGENEPVEVEVGILRNPISASDFGRYSFHPRTNSRLLFPYRVSHHGYEALSETEFRSGCPLAYRYLSARKKDLMKRKQFREWYGYSAPRSLHVILTGHILVPLLAERGSCALLPEERGQYCLMASAGFCIKLRNQELAPPYVLGLLNSKLLFWNLKKISNKFRGGWITCTKQFFSQLPIRTIDFSDRADKARHDKMVDLVARMLALHKKLAEAKTDHEKTILQRQIEMTDQQIDQFVYELYGLTDEEIAIVEQETKK